MFGVRNPFHIQGNPMKNNLPSVTEVCVFLMTIFLLASLLSSCGPQVETPVIDLPKPAEILLDMRLVSWNEYVEVYILTNGFTQCFIVINPKYDNMAPSISCVRY